MSTVIIITPPPKQQQRATGSLTVDGTTITGPEGDVVMYCQDADEALRYLKRVCKDEG